MTGQKTQTAKRIEHRSRTAEEYKQANGWQIGTFHRASLSDLVKARQNSREREAAKEDKPT